MDAPPSMTQLLVEGPRAVLRRAGLALGAAVQPGDVVALTGGLGAGKTFFAQSIARGAGVPLRVRVASPTFTIVQRYTGRMPVFHADLYRLGSARELDDVGLFAQAEDGVAVVEWADRFPAAVPRGALWITLAPGRTRLQRRLLAGYAGEAGARLAAAVRSSAARAAVTRT